MLYQSPSFSDSDDDSESDGEWGRQQRGRLTAVEELRGHLVDCLSLYGSRFLSADLSALAVEIVKPDEGTNRSTAVSQDEAGHHHHHSDFDASTVATMLMLRDGAKSATPGAPFGVVVRFQYWAGFTVYAERAFSSVAEAQETMRELAHGTYTIEQLTHDGSGWALVPGRSAATHVYPSDAQAEAMDGTGDGASGEAAAYESLMSLLVSRYL